MVSDSMLRDGRGLDLNNMLNPTPKSPTVTSGDDGQSVIGSSHSRGGHMSRMFDESFGSGSHNINPGSGSKNLKGGGDLSGRGESMRESMSPDVVGDVSAYSSVGFMVQHDDDDMEWGDAGSGDVSAVEREVIRNPKP